MKSLKKNLFIACCAALMIFTACGEDEDSNPSVNSSATVNFQNLTWTKSDTSDVTFDTFLGLPLSAIVQNGSEIREVFITIPSTTDENGQLAYQPGTYTKATNGDDGNVQISSGTNQVWEVETFGCIGDFNDPEDNYCDSLAALTDYRIIITSSSASSLEGEFEADLVNYTTGSLETASGEFVAINPFGSFLGGLQ